MTLYNKSITAALLAIMLIVGMIANPSAAFDLCKPKACCCSGSPVHNTAYGDHMGASSPCTGNSPCCQVEPSMPFPEMAVTASMDTTYPKTAPFTDLAVRDVRVAQQVHLPTLLHKAGLLKIPQPSIILQTQSFLY